MDLPPGMLHARRSLLHGGRPMTWLVIAACRALFVFLACVGGAVIAAFIVSRRVRKELHTIGILCDRIQRVGESSDERIAAANADADTAECVCDPMQVLEFQSRQPSRLREVAHAGR